MCAERKAYSYFVGRVVPFIACGGRQFAVCGDAGREPSYRALEGVVGNEHDIWLFNSCACGFFCGYEHEQTSQALLLDDACFCAGGGVCHRDEGNLAGHSACPGHNFCEQRGRLESIIAVCGRRRPLRYGGRFPGSGKYPESCFSSGTLWQFCDITVCFV